MDSLPSRTVVLAVFVASASALLTMMLAMPVLRPAPQPEFCPAVIPLDAYSGVSFGVQDFGLDGPGPCDVSLSDHLARVENRNRRGSGGLAPIRDYWCVVHYPSWWDGSRVELVPEPGCVPYDGPRWLAEVYGA